MSPPPANDLRSCCAASHQQTRLHSRSPLTTPCSRSVSWPLLRSGAQPGRFVTCRPSPHASSQPRMPEPTATVTASRSWPRVCSPTLTQSSCPSPSQSCTRRGPTRTGYPYTTTRTCGATPHQASSSARRSCWTPRRRSSSRQSPRLLLSASLQTLPTGVPRSVPTRCAWSVPWPRAHGLSLRPSARPVRARPPPCAPSRRRSRAREQP